MKFNNGQISTEDLLRAVQKFDLEVRQLSRPDWLRVVAFLLNDEDAPPPYRLVCAVAHTFGAGATATLHSDWPNTLPAHSISESKEVLK